MTYQVAQMLVYPEQSEEIATLAKAIDMLKGQPDAANVIQMLMERRDHLMSHPYVIKDYDPKEYQQWRS